MEIYNATSLPAMFFDQAERLGEEPFLFHRRKKQWQWISWTSTARQIETMARGMRALGLADGDRVLLISENRPEWLIADLAVMSAGGVTVPGYTTNTVSDHLHILNDSGASIAIASTKALAERVMVAAIQAHRTPIVIVMETEGLQQNPGVDLHSWNDVAAMASSAANDIAARVAALKRNSLACLIYTSGTGGRPKGVMLSHGAMTTNCMGAYHLLLELGLTQERFLSFLPLSHSYEHTAGQFFPISLGAQIWYAEGLDQLVPNMADCQPTIMTAVPRLYEVMRTRILATVDRGGGLKAQLFHRAVKLGSKRYEKPGWLNPLEWIENLALHLLVRRKVAKRFGGKLKALVSGGAPLNYDVGLFFTALGVRLVQGYGQTEAAPVISANRPLAIKLHTVGPPLRGVEVRIADDGEILVRGELMMLGYWNDPASTANAIRDGWLHTGDIGVIDEDGNIRITDRKKDLIVNSGGDNISPQRVEGYLTLQPEIAQAMVYGDRRPHLVALLVPAPEPATAWAAAHNQPTDLAALVTNTEFRRHISDAVDRVNRDLSPIERVRQFILTAEAFTVTNEMSTPTLKIRRHAIKARYGAALDELYEDRKG